MIILSLLSLHFKNINNPTLFSIDSTLEFISNWPFGESNTLFVQDTIAFLGSGGGIFILNISNPDSITKISEIRTREYVKKVLRKNQLLYLINGKNNILVYDISLLTNPQFISNFHALKVIQDIYVNNNFLFLIGTADNDTQQLEIFSLNNPNNPQLIGNISISSIRLSKIVVDGELAFVIESPERLRIINVNNPSSPYIISTSTTWGHPNDLLVSENKLYLLTDFGVEVDDISTPHAPQRLDTLRISGGVSKAALNQGNMYAMSYIDTLYTIDITEPAHPNIVASINIPDSSIDLQVRGGFAYIANREGGLIVIDLSKYNLSQIRYGFVVPNRYQKFAIYDNYSFLPDLNGRLWIVQNDSINPLLINSLKITQEGGFWDISLTNDHAYLSDTRGNIWALNIHDPSNPMVVDSIGLEGANTLLFAENDTIFSVNTVSGLQVLTLDNFQNLRLLSTLNFTSISADPSSIFEKNGFIYITDRSNGQIHIANIHNIHHPRWITHLYLDEGREYPTNIYVKNNKAFITCISGRLWIYDVSNPYNPQRDTVLNDFNDTTFYILKKIWACQNHLFILGGNTSGSFLWVRDVNSPYTIRGRYALTLHPMQIYCGERYLYTVDYYTGLQIYRLHPTTVKGNNSNYSLDGVTVIPNSVKNLDLTLLVPANMTIQAQLFDILGRVVIPSKIYSSGRYRIKKKLPTGIYLLIIKDPHTRQRETLKISVIK